jgi:succinate dehydrogenase/fumarate reductase-like Fe-S protein
VFNIQTLPKQVKDIVVDRYHMLKDYQPSIRFMNAADRDTPEIREQRKARILQTDKYRKENFGEMFPLLNNILKIYD